jgi:hypothetical protein
LTDINHFGYALRRYFTKAMGRTKVRASGRVAGLASVRLTMSTYHVDLPKSTTACCASIGAAHGMGSSLKNVKPQSSKSVPVAMSDRAWLPRRTTALSPAPPFPDFAGSADIAKTFE